MTDKTETNEAPCQSMRPSLPRRQSYERVAQEIEKWANSGGLQKPK
jgi:hypothetical protein